MVVVWWSLVESGGLWWNLVACLSFVFFVLMAPTDKNAYDIFGTDLIGRPIRFARSGTQPQPVPTIETRHVVDDHRVLD